MINIQNGDDNGCFKWSDIYMMQTKNPARMIKLDKDSWRKIDFKFPVKSRDTHKIVSALVFFSENSQSTF